MITHHRTLALGLAALTLPALFALGGCQSTKAPAPAARVHAPGNPNPALVMPPQVSLVLGDDYVAWEASRNDVGLGMLNPPLEATFGVAIIRQRESLGTSNGRPRDNSWMFSRSVKTRVGP